MRFSLFAASCISILLASPGLGQVIHARAGFVYKVEGVVVYSCTANGVLNAPIAKGDTLHDNDTVLTSEGGSLIIGLNPDSHLLVAANSFVRVVKTDLEAMHVDLERGDITVAIKSLPKGVAFALHTPPSLLVVDSVGLYGFQVKAKGETEAIVVAGKMRYLRHGRWMTLRSGRTVNFVRAASDSVSGGSIPSHF